jgi:hypothetical protein
MQFADPNNMMAWMNPAAYAAFMNPATYMYWMNPATYTHMMNPAMYMQAMNPAAYNAYMNPNTYMQWMNPGAYAMPATASTGAVPFNFFDPNLGADGAAGFDGAGPAVRIAAYGPGRSGANKGHGANRAPFLCDRACQENTALGAMPHRRSRIPLKV